MKKKRKWKRTGKNHQTFKLMMTVWRRGWGSIYIYIFLHISRDKIPVFVLRFSNILFCSHRHDSNSSYSHSYDSSSCITVINTDTMQALFAESENWLSPRDPSRPAPLPRRSVMSCTGQAGEVRGGGRGRGRGLGAWRKGEGKGEGIWGKGQRRDLESV